MIYEYKCESCKNPQGDLHTFDVVKHHSSSSRGEWCPLCGRAARRIYGFKRTKEFVPFFDELYNCEITSQRQEDKLMKEHGHIDIRDNKSTVDRFKFDVRRKQKKPVYFHR